MSTSFSGEDFAKALVEESLKEPVVLTGMVKASEDLKVILFSPGASCQQWVSVPVEMVDKVEWLGKISCRDHTHDHVLLFLKDEGSPVIQAFAALLRNYARLQTPLLQNLLTPNTAAQRLPAIGEEIEEEIQPLLTPSRAYTGYCHIYVNGQLWGTFYTTERGCRRCRVSRQFYPMA